MSEDQKRVIQIAAAVADAREIDWEAELSSEPATLEERELLRGLHELALIFRAHREIAEPSLPAEDRRPPVAGEGEAAPQRWGPLEIQEVLGAGVSGEVYRARHSELAMDVALKVLRPSGAAKESLQEGRLLARIRHPNVVRVHGAERHDGRTGIWMELVRGRTLADLVAQSGPLGAREAALVGIDLCRALAAIHGAGLVHRDVKAQNVMREEGGRIVLMDLGAGMSRDDAEGSSEQLAGTPMYMAPEVIDGQRATAASDLYGVGVLLFHLVTGTYPFTARSIASLERVRGEGRETLLRDARPGLPEKFVTVVERALDPDPEHRFPSAGAMERELRAVLGDAPPVVPAAGEVASGKAKYRGLPKTYSGWRWGVVALTVLGIAIASVWMVTRGKPPAHDTGAITSLAVLPFDNMSNDAEQQYFVDGMHETLITDLSKIGALKVISRTSMMRYRGTEKSIPAIAEELGVDALVEGSVLLAGNDVRISAQLIDGETDEHLWAESYTRPLEDVLVLHSELSRAIADEIQVVSETKQGTPSSRTASAKAYTLVLQGKYFEERRSEENLEKAKGYYQRALEIDPAYSLAWARLAGILAEQASFAFLPFDEGFEAAREAAERALELDDSQTVAWIVLSEVRLKKDFDFSGADAAAQQALKLRPGDAEVLRMAAYVATICGRLEEALAMNRKTIDLDPLNVRNYRSLAIRLRYLKRLEEAEAALKQALEFNPDQAMAHRSLGLLYLDLGKLEAALAEMEKETFPEMRIQGLALVYHALGRHQEADKALAKLIEVGSDTSAFQIAQVYAYRDEPDAAFEWLQRGYAIRDPGIIETGISPLFANLYDDPRWPIFLKKLGLTGGFGAVRRFRLPEA